MQWRRQTENNNNRESWYCPSAHWHLDGVLPDDVTFYIFAVFSVLLHVALIMCIHKFRMSISLQVFTFICVTVVQLVNVNVAFKPRSGVVVEYRTRNRQVAGSTHTRYSGSNGEQVANLLCAQANSASYPQRDGKWVVATATGWRLSVADWGDGVYASCTVSPMELSSAKTGRVYFFNIFLRRQVFHVYILCLCGEKSVHVHVKKWTCPVLVLESLIVC